MNEPPIREPEEIRQGLAAKLRQIEADGQFSTALACFLADASDRGTAPDIQPKSDGLFHRGGSVLIELGRIDEGVELLGQAFDGNMTKQNKAFNACYLALAMSRKGDEGEATRFLEKARRLDSTCPLIGRVEREVARLG